MVTIRDVSERAGVSRSTASRVIAKNGYVSDDARRAVEMAIADLGYRPNAMAQGLRSLRSNMIGGVVVNITSPFYAQLIAGAQEIARPAGKFIVMSSGYADQDEESHAIIELIDRSCDGLVLYLENPLRGDVVDIIHQSDTPVITVGWVRSGVARGNVKIDNYSGAMALAEHVLKRGHRKIVHLGGQPNFGDSRDRWRGIQSALKLYGLTTNDIYVEHGAYDEAFGFEATTRLLSEGRQFTAILAGDDDVAAGAMQAVKRAGLRVPEDVSIVGFDDNFHARHLTPTLTTVRQPIEEAGRVAVEMLLKILSGETLHRNELVLPAVLVERESVQDLTL